MSIKKEFVRGTRYKLLSFCLVFAVMLMSCKNTISDQEKTPETVAKAYVESMFSFNNISNGRSADAFSIPEFFYEMKVEEEDGTIKTFADYSDAEKKLMVEAWKETQINDYAEKFSKDSFLMEGIAVQNEAFSQGVARSARCAKDKKEEAFIESYVKAYEKGIKKLFKAREAEEESELGESEPEDPEEKKDWNQRWDENLNRDSLKKFVENYKRGRVLYRHWHIVGHSSMMYMEDDNVRRYTNNDLWTGTTKAAITSYPPHNDWPGQVDGVQLEPIGYWCQEDKGLIGAKDVKVLKVVGQYSWFKWVNGSLKVPGQQIGEKNSVNNKAVSYADKIKTETDEYGNIIKEGRPYVPAGAKAKQPNAQYVVEFIKYKDSNEYSYCSQLVWKGYKESGTEYNFAILLPWISPFDIQASSKTKAVTEWTNY